jgi:hypothetical protein
VRLAGGLARPGSAFWLALPVALVAQGLLFGLGAALRSRPVWLGLSAQALGAAVLAVPLNIALLVVIPTLTLIERDSRPDVGELDETRTLEGYDLPVAARPGVAAAGHVLLRPSSGPTFVLLRLPGCALEPTAIPVDAAQVSLLPGGRALFARLRPREARYDWFLAPGGDREPRPLALADWTERLPPPVLLSGGAHAAWLEPRQTEAGYAVSEPPWAFLVVLDLATGSARRVPLATVGRGSWRLVGGDGPEGPFRIRRDGPRELLSIDAAGAVSPSRPAQPGPELEGALDELVLFRDGWLGWDVYTERPRYIVAWDLAGGRGRVEEPKGRGISSAAADPRGRFVAYSTTTTLNVGGVPDAVVLVRAADGREIFRRTLPRYTRAQVALPDGFFVWSDASVRPGRVRVHPLPPP